MWLAGSIQCLEMFDLACDLRQPLWGLSPARPIFVERPRCPDAGQVRQIGNRRPIRAGGRRIDRWRFRRARRRPATPSASRTPAHLSDLMRLSANHRTRKAFPSSTRSRIRLSCTGLSANLAANRPQIGRRSDLGGLMPAPGANSGELALYGAAGLAMALSGAGLALLSDRKGCPGPGPRQWH